MYVCVGVGSEGIEYGWIYSTKVPDRGMCMHVVNGVSIEPFFCVYLGSRCTPPPRPPISSRSSRSSRSYLRLAVFYDQVVKRPSRSSVEVSRSYFYLFYVVFLPSTSSPPIPKVVLSGIPAPFPPDLPKIVEVVEVVEVICVWLYFTTNSLNGQVEGK